MQKDDFQSDNSLSIFGISNNDLNASVEDKIEDESLGNILQPFDPSEIRIDTKPMSMDLFITRLEEHEINLSPSFQRRGDIWTPKAQSQLIESILVGIPLPSFYMDATDDECWEVVDGQQRLMALKCFVVDKNLRLQGLEFLKNLEGLLFDELPRRLQRRIKETQVMVYIIEKGTPENLKFNIFKRINTGGMPLSPQEIRHALKQGLVTKLLQIIAESEEFRLATCGSIKDVRMADQELILRLLTVLLTIDYTKKESVQDYDTVLNITMDKVNNMSNAEIENLNNKVIYALKTAREIFDFDAFRKRYSKNDSRKPINKPLFDTWAYNLAKLGESERAKLIQNKDEVKEKFIALMHDKSFEGSITQATWSYEQLYIRFSKIEQLIKEVLM